MKKSRTKRPSMDHENKVQCIVGVIKIKCSLIINNIPWQ